MLIFIKNFSAVWTIKFNNAIKKLPLGEVESGVLTRDLQTLITVQNFFNRSHICEVCIHVFTQQCRLKKYLMIRQDTSREKYEFYYLVLYTRSYRWDFIKPIMEKGM